MDHGFRKYDFADLEVDLLVFEDIDLLYPPADAHILEYIYSDVDNGWLTWAGTLVHTFNNKIIILHPKGWLKSGLLIFLLQFGLLLDGRHFDLFIFWGLLGERGSAFGTFGVYFGPVLDALAVEKMFAGGVDGLVVFFIFGQADWANHLPLLFSRYIIKTIFFVCFLHLKKWIFLKHRFK